MQAAVAFFTLSLEQLKASYYKSSWVARLVRKFRRVLVLVFVVCSQRRVKFWLRGRSAMASSGGLAMRILLFCCCLGIVVIKPALADGNAQFLDDINQYRLAQSLPKFKTNSGAACVAQQVAVQYKGTPCSNTTGTATVSGQEPQLDESILSKCNLQLVNVKDGFMGPTCVAAGTSAANAPTLAANNITMSPAYSEFVTDAKFVSAGAGSVDNAWFVLVLGTNSSGGNYVNQDLDPSSHAAVVAVSASLGFVSVVASVVAAFVLA